MSDTDNPFCTNGSSPPTGETFNGYPNRETWAFNMLWSNDYVIYTTTLEVAAAYLAENPDASDNNLGAHVVTFWRERESRAIRDYFAEVGSWWRVVWDEVGAAVRDSLDAEGAAT